MKARESDQSKVISYSKEGVAENCGVSLSSVKLAQAQGLLTPRYWGTKPLFLRRELEAFIESLPTSPDRRTA